MIRAVFNLVGFVVYIAWHLFTFVVACALMPLLLIDVVRMTLGKKE